VKKTVASGKQSNKRKRQQKQQKKTIKKQKITQQGQRELLLLNQYELSFTCNSLYAPILSVHQQNLQHPRCLFHHKGMLRPN